MRKFCEPKRAVVPGGAGTLRDERARATPLGTWRLRAPAQLRDRTEGHVQAVTKELGTAAENRSWEGRGELCGERAA